MNKKLTRSEIRSFIKTILTEEDSSNDKLKFSIDKFGTTAVDPKDIGNFDPKDPKDLRYQAVITHMINAFPESDPFVKPAHWPKFGAIVLHFLRSDLPFKNDMLNILKTAVRLNKEKIEKIEK